jgi:hypothetical protein
MTQITGPQGPWQPYFAKLPIKIKGKWFWRSTVYRREKNRVVWPKQGYEFGTVFDVLRDA